MGRVEGAVEFVSQVAAGIAAFGFCLDSGVADAELFVQALVQDGDNGLTFTDRAVAGQDNMAGQEVQAVADSPNMHVVDIADRRG